MRNTAVTIREDLDWPTDLIPTSADEIFEMSYPDFVATINQTNVCPGAFATLSRWSVFSNLSQNSSILEVACSTGFAARELARSVGCSAFGFDKSERAIRAASYNARTFASGVQLQFEQADGYSFDLGNRKFSHLVVGSSLGFFKDPSEMLKKALGWIHDGGYVLATGFISDRPLPQNVLDARREVFGITIAEETYADLMRYFRGLEICYDYYSMMNQEEGDELNHYLSSTVSRFQKLSNVKDPKILRAVRERLRLVKETTNILRKYQRYAVYVLKYNQAQFPQRYVELF